jgi:hypothetical protein
MYGVAVGRESSRAKEGQDELDAAVTEIRGTNPKDGGVTLAADRETEPKLGTWAMSCTFGRGIWKMEAE